MPKYYVSCEEMYNNVPLGAMQIIPILSSHDVHTPCMPQCEGWGEGRRTTMATQSSSLVQGAHQTPLCSVLQPSDVFLCITVWDRTWGGGIIPAGERIDRGCRSQPANVARW